MASPRLISATSSSTSVVALGLLVAAACADEPVTVVHLEARRAVGEVAQLEVSLDNDNATQRETFAVNGRDFPLSFSIQTPGRTGTLAIRVEARNGGGEVRAASDAAIELDPEARVDVTMMLEPTDFVVNTVYVGGQDLAFRVDGGGRQLSAGADGRFTIGWSDTCEVVGRCDVFGRRFDDTGTALSTQLAAGTTQFNLNRTDGQIGYEPSLATDRSGNTLAAWSTDGDLYAVVVDAAGAAATGIETTVAAASTPGTPAVLALPDGRFVVAWNDASPIMGQRVIKARYLSSTGTPINNPVTGTADAFQVSTTALTDDLAPAVVAFDNGAAFAVAWVAGSTIRGRFYGTTGLPGGLDLVLATHAAADQLEAPQLGTLGGDALILYRRGTNGGDADNGQLILRRMSAQGIHVGADAIVTDDVELGPGGLATQGNDVAVVWSSCTTRSDGAGCGIWLRHYDVNLAPSGPAMLVNTTLAGDQEDPSVAWLPGKATAVAWTDGSMAAPDMDGGAVRARIVYPIPE